MFTVIETPTFSKLAADYWTEEERGEFAAWLAANPEAGNVVLALVECAKSVGRARAAASAVESE